MKKRWFITALGCGLLTGTALAGTNEWTAGWGMGVTEYHVSNANGNALLVASPDNADTDQLRAYAFVSGREYSSHGSGAEQFDLIMDGKRYSNPFFTNCRVCDANFPLFWDAFRNANLLAIQVKDSTVHLSTTNISELFHPLGSELNSCRSAW